MIEGVDKPSQRQVTRMLEQMILMREPGYEPGWVIPPASTLARELGLAPETVQGAYRRLANLGLLTLRPGYGAVVREQRERETIHVLAGSTVTARMPTFAEQDEWDLDPGVPMLVVDGRAYPGDRYELKFGKAVGDTGSGGDPGRVRLGGGE